MNIEKKRTLRIVLASDHAGFSAKEKLVPVLQKAAHSVIDLGVPSEEPADYPDLAEKTARSLLEGRGDRGILICGSGVGVCVAANKFPGIRAGICHDCYSARQGVEHDDMNVLCLGSRVLGFELMREIVLVFLEATFSGHERHRLRLEKLKKTERSNMKGGIFYPAARRPARKSGAAEHGSSTKGENMFIERIISEGIAHYSYLIKTGGEALVIDPRRDCGVYLEKTLREGIPITHILETHRNEDYVIGSLELASRTGATIWHADSQLDYQYGYPVEEGQEWELGGAKLEALHTPGHTLGSMSYLLRNPEGVPWMIFCGDVLFAGDVGRTDLLGMERARELAGMLHDTLFQKLLPLGDGVILCPAHGAGSACGSSITDRQWTTIGLERKLNPMLRIREREEFVSQAARELEFPPYFKTMEEINVQGAGILGDLPLPPALSAKEFSQRMNNSEVLDTRMELGFSAAHVPGSLSIWLEGVPGKAGWFLSYEQPLLLVTEERNPARAVRHLVRLGYDNIEGYLSGGLLAWHTAGLESSAVRTVTVQELCTFLDKGHIPLVLDVRSQEELEREGRIPGALHIHITQLPLRISEIPVDREIHIFCGSGLRSMIAASLLKRKGREDIVVVLGGFAGWNSTTCPIQGVPASGSSIR
jgi:hydroxyacylglutathione hydrolase